VPPARRLDAGTEPVQQIAHFIQSDPTGLRQPKQDQPVNGIRCVSPLPLTRVALGKMPPLHLRDAQDRRQAAYYAELTEKDGQTAAEPFLPAARTQKAGSFASVRACAGLPLTPYAPLQHCAGCRGAGLPAPSALRT
jgi:hypothetical protein